MARTPPPPTMPPVVTRWEDVPEFPDEDACRTFWRGHLMGPQLFGVDPRRWEAAPKNARKDFRTYLQIEVFPVWGAVAPSLLLSLERGKVCTLSREVGDRIARAFDYPDADALLRDPRLAWLDEGLEPEPR